MTKTDEAFEEVVLTLRIWLDFIEVKKKEASEQLERARRRAEKEGETPATGTGTDGPSLQVEVRNEEDRENWL